MYATVYDICDIINCKVKSINEDVIKWSKFDKTVYRIVDTQFTYENKCLTPLLLASLLNDVTSVWYLIKYGANINATDSTGSSSVHLTTNLDIVKYLADNGADLNLTNIDNKTPILLAYERSDIKLVKLFINLGVDLQCVMDLLGVKYSTPNKESVYKTIKRKIKMNVKLLN